MYEKLEIELAKLESEVERLRTLFEQYFMGIEKVPPLKLQKQLGKDIRFSNFKKVHNTELRFRFRGLAQKYVSYSSYWDRTMRLIEEGNFKRERYAAPNADHPVTRRRLQRTYGEDIEAAPARLREDADLADQAPAQRAGSTAAAAAAAAAADARPAARATAPTRPAFEDRLGSLYEEFVQARSANGESTRGLTFDTFKASVTKTRASHMAQFRCADLDYQVKTRNGRVSLVAQPLRDSDGPSSP